MRFRASGFISSPVKQLVIELGNLPEGGKQLSGALSPDVFGLEKADSRPLGPLKFDLQAQRLENELLLMGHLEAPFEFECVRTLQRFKMTIRADNAAIALEIGPEGAIDVTEALREELLLAFPSYPRCDEGDDPMPCELNPQYLAVDKPVAGDVENPPDPHGDSRWAALDQLEPPESEP